MHILCVDSPTVVAEVCDTFNVVIPGTVVHIDETVSADCHESNYM